MLLKLLYLQQMVSSVIICVMWLNELFFSELILVFFEDVYICIEQNTEL